ncbi:conserved hypothetical protein [Vibrio nigripulchritudo FTn2]|uniref:hypothetical protein n=1 Tax=Vibrio nigripulchritudo TaxID=28173 RepID=UPI0003B1989B|nr:hypothetical protein [Vibrio nigripulchritudo]CCN40356.1 conserved hypothetical protein [Vibrio nigripulchritudo FTn2]
MESRNQRYERKKKEQGLVKTTLWVPESIETEIKQIVAACAENPELTISTLRNIKTGRMVSLRDV